MTPSSSTPYDAIVIGLGAIGAATLYQLAKRGVRVLGIDRFNPPHDQGSSHGESRITRLAIGEGDGEHGGDAYVPLVQRSHDIWRELEALTGRTVMTTTAGLIMGPREGVTQHHGKVDFVRRTIASAERHGIAHQVLEAADVRRRYPQFGVSGDELIYWERDAGFVRPEEAIAAQLQAALMLGAHIRTDEPVLGLQPVGNGDTVRVETARGMYSAGQVVVAAGAWLPAFLGDTVRASWHGDFQVYRQTMHWFDPGRHAPDFAPGRMPVFIWMFGGDDDDFVYGFPSANASQPALKVATEQYLATTDPGRMDRSVSAGETRDFYQRLLAARFPQIDGSAIQAKACLYTVTPDHNFVVDTLDDAANVLVVSACSGHGFKHSAGLGDALADKVLRTETRFDLRPFSRDRLKAKTAKI